MPLTEVAAPDPGRWRNTEEAAAHTGFSTHYIRDAANSGRLRGYRAGTGPKAQWRFRVADLDAFVEHAPLGPRRRRAAS